MFRHALLDADDAVGGGSAPSFVAGGAVVAGSSSIQLQWPEGHEADDIGILLCQTYNQTSGVLPTDCHMIYFPTGVNSGGKLVTRLYALWIRATSDNMPPIAIADSGDHQLADLLVFRGCVATGSPIHKTAKDTASSSTSITVPGLTTTVANAMIVAAVGCSNSADNDHGAAAWTNASLASIAEAVHAFTSVANRGGLLAAYGLKATAGAVSNTTATLSDAEVQERVCIALAGA
jgi:hypothetical protein